jgi:predicted RNA-binding protein with PUA-like domain
MISYWLMKSEPDEFSIDDLVRAPGKSTPWFGVRNYQARNFMRDAMRVGDGVLFYHSSCEVPGIAGLARVASGAYPDETQFDRASPYFDPKSTRENPRWLLVDVTLERKTRLMPLEELRGRADLAGMVVLRRGNRLSITPVTAGEWKIVTKLLASDAR